MFWRVCGDTNPLLAGGGLRYHQLSFLKRVWIFKGLCDTVAHSHKTVQEAMALEEGPESREVLLGHDSAGFTYFHFPAVSGSDIRVYRQKAWDLDVDPIWAPIAAEQERRVAEEQRQLALSKRKKVTAARRTVNAFSSSARKSRRNANTYERSPRILGNSIVNSFFGFFGFFGFFFFNFTYPIIEIE